MSVTGADAEIIERLLGPVRDAPAFRLDAESVGNQMIRLVAVARQFGHSRPSHSICYLNHEDNPEGEFVDDMMSGMSTKALADKWFGGMEGAGRFAAVCTSVAFRRIMTGDPGDGS